MNDKQAKVRKLAEGLAVGESRREEGLCYFCNGGNNKDRGTLRVTADQGYIRWICFRDKCRATGILGSLSMQSSRTKRVWEPKVYDKPLETLRFATFRHAPVSSTGRTLSDYFTYEECREQRWRCGTQDARLVMPVFDFRGFVIGHVARAFGTKVGIRSILYREHDSTMLHFPIQSEALGYSLSVLVLTEDIFSSVKVSRSIPAASCMGTSFTSDMAQILRGIQLQRLLLMFDGDEAGVTAALRAWRKAESLGISASILPCPQGKDPKDLTKTEVEKLISNHLSLLP